MKRARFIFFILPLIFGCAKNSVVSNKKSAHKAHPAQKMAEVERVSGAIIAKYTACYSDELDILDLVSKKELKDDQFMSKLMDAINSKIASKKLQKPYTYYRDNLEDSIIDVSTVYYNSYLKNSPIKVKAQELLGKLNRLDSYLINIPEVTFERRF